MEQQRVFSDSKQKKNSNYRVEMPDPLPATSKPIEKHRLSNIAGIIFSIVFIVPILLLGHAYYRSYFSPQAKAIAKLKESAEPAYYPARTVIDKSTVSQENNLVTYTAQYKGNSFYVSIQPPPPNLNLIIEHELSNKRSVDTPAGPGLIGLLHQNLVGMLVTKDTWLLVSANGSTTEDDLLKVMQSLKRLN